jgi:hypothetical protein
VSAAAAADLIVSIRESAEQLAQACHELGEPSAPGVVIALAGNRDTAEHLARTTGALAAVIQEGLLQIDALTPSVFGAPNEHLALRRAQRSLHTAARLQRLAARCLENGVHHLERASGTAATAPASPHGGQH